MGHPCRQASYGKREFQHWQEEVNAEAARNNEPPYKYEYDNPMAQLEGLPPYEPPAPRPLRLAPYQPKDVRPPHARRARVNGLWRERKCAINGAGTPQTSRQRARFL